MLDAALDRVANGLTPRPLRPRPAASRRLSMEATVTIGMARRLLARLRAADPAAGALGRPGRHPRLPRVLFRGPSDAVLARARVAAAGGSSFTRGMAALRGDRRARCGHVYAFCRVVDDIADGAMPDAEKHRFLVSSRGKLGSQNRTAPLSRELARARDPLRPCRSRNARR